MRPFSKKNLKADLTEFSNHETKDANEYIVRHGNVLRVVVALAKNASSEDELNQQLFKSIGGVLSDFGINIMHVQWHELAYAWFHTVKRDEPPKTKLPGMPYRPPQSAIEDIKKLPTLDKPKKIDELLEQLSIETDPTKQEKIKQHIERIKRGKLLRNAAELGDPISPYPPEEAGSQEISIYHPAYDFLVRLVKLVSKVAPEATPEIKQLAESYPFKTVNDVGDLTAKIWTLATTKYNIPREWLISKLPEKKGSLNKIGFVRKSDLADFYLLTLLPKEYYEYYPEVKALAETVIFSLKDQYLAQGKEVLSHEIFYIDKNMDKDMGFLIKKYPYTENDLASQILPYYKKVRTRRGIDFVFKGEVDKYSFSDFYNLFAFGNFTRSYGGKKWAVISDSFVRLEKASNVQSIIIAIDHINDLAHNNANIMTKLFSGSSYSGDVQDWIENFLDAKATSRAFETLIPMASSDVRKIVVEYLNIQKGRKEPSLAASLKKADLWPAQEAASEGTLTQAPGQIATNPMQEKDTSVSGPNPNDVVDEESLWEIVSDKFFGQHLRWSEVIKSIRSTYPNVTDSVILSLKDRVRKSLDNQMGMIGSKKVAAIGFGMWMSPKGEIIDISSHPDYAFDNAKELGLQNIPEQITDENAAGIYESLMEQMFEKGWVRLRLTSNELNIELYDLQSVPDMLNDFIIEHPTKQIRVANAWGDDVILDYDSVIENGIQKAVNLEHQPEEEQVVAASLKTAKSPEMEFYTTNYSSLSEEDKKMVKKLSYTGDTGFRGFIENFDMQMFIAKKNGIIIGWSAYGQSPYVKTSAVVFVFIDRNYREQGLGQQLFNSAVSEAKKAGFKRIETYPTNKPESQEFMEKRKEDVKEKGLRYEKVSKRKLNMDQVIKILDSKENKVEHIDFTTNEIELLNGERISFEEATSRAMEIDKTGLFQGSEFSNTEFNVNPTLDLGPYSSPQDQGKGHQKKPFPNTMWDVSSDEDGDAQPYSNIAASKDDGHGQCAKSEATWSVRLFDGRGIQYFPNEELANKYYEVALKEDKDPFKPQPFINKKAFCKKEANPPSRFWIAPDGKEFPVFGSHGTWIMQDANLNILKSYGIKGGIQGQRGLTNIWDDMMNDGWIRISTEPAGTGFQIELNDLSNIPAYLDDFIAKNFKRGDKILIGNARDKGITITNPFPNIQKAVNKALRNPINASKKQAAISGKIVRDILEIVESSGGITYNLSKGNLAQSDNYAVSIFPQREQILEGVAEHDDIQHYLDTNEDLLSDPNNSFGVWISNNKTYLDVVVTIPNREQALKLARENNQLAIWSLKEGKEITTGIVRAFNKNDIIKKAEESPLTEDQANQISSKSCPAYVISINNYYEAKKRGHSTDRSLAYAIDSVKNLEKIDEKKLVEFINTYLGPVK